MKFNLSKITLTTLAAMLLSLFSLNVFAATTNTNDPSSPFTYVPKTCNIIGALNLDSMKKIAGVEQAMNKTQNDPLYQCLKVAGLTADNIDDIYFGMNITKETKDTPPFIALLKTESKYDLNKFVSESKNYKKDIKVTPEKYQGSDLYQFSNDNTQDQQEPIYFAKLSDTLLAIGSKNYVEGTMDLASGKNSESVMNNKSLTDLSSTIKKDDMFWVAANLPKMNNQGENAKSEDKLPAINNGVLVLNYLDTNLVVTGQINCASKQDVQKILLPAQMFIGMFAMNPDNGINAQDIQLKPSDKSIDINIKIPEKAINNIINSQIKQDQENGSLGENADIETQTTVIETEQDSQQ